MARFLHCEARSVIFSAVSKAVLRMQHARRDKLSIEGILKLTFRISQGAKFVVRAHEGFYLLVYHLFHAPHELTNFP